MGYLGGEKQACRSSQGARPGFAKAVSIHAVKVSPIPCRVAKSARRRSSHAKAVQSSHPKKEVLAPRIFSPWKHSASTCVSLAEPGVTERCAVPHERPQETRPGSACQTGTSERGGSICFVRESANWRHVGTQKRPSSPRCPGSSDVPWLVGWNHGHGRRSSWLLVTRHARVRSRCRHSAGTESSPVVEGVKQLQVVDQAVRSRSHTTTLSRHAAPNNTSDLVTVELQERGCTNRSGHRGVSQEVSFSSLGHRVLRLSQAGVEERHQHRRVRKGANL